MKLFEKYGMTNLIYWNVLQGTEGRRQDAGLSAAHKSQEAAKKSFDAFRADPDVDGGAQGQRGEGRRQPDREGRAASCSEFLKPTDYSPLK